MCWSFTASAAMVAVGTSAAVVTGRRGLPIAIPVALGYFTIMEALQAAGYLVVDQCGSPANQAITLASYVHIVLQPVFINALAMTFIPEPVRLRIRGPVYAICFLASAFMVLQLYPAEWAGVCRVGQPLCGSELCLRSGQWHIAWDIPYNGLAGRLDDVIGTNFGFPSYLLSVFALPMLYGSWRFTIFHLIAGPVLAMAVTPDINEVPAVWCLFSVAIIIVAVTPALLRQAHVSSWMLWPRAWTSHDPEPAAR